MEEKSGKGNTVLLAVIGAATLLVVVVGATFAYFSSQLSGSTTSNIDITTSDLGTTQIVFPSSNSIRVDQANLRYEELQAYISENPGATEYPMDYDMNFVIDTTSEIDLRYDIYFRSVSNEFCQYVAGVNDTTCKNVPGVCSVGTAETQADCIAAAGTWTDYIDARGEVTYRLERCIAPTKVGSQYSCSDQGVLGDATDDWGATPVVADTNFPTSTVTGYTVPIAQGITIPGITTPGTSSYQLYKLTVTLHNLNTVQNYQSNKLLTAKLQVDLVDQDYSYNDTEIRAER